VTVNVRHLPEADMFELKVTDTGIEIPKEKVQFIFDTNRWTAPLPRRYGGVGPGLSIVKKFTDIGLMSKSELGRDPRSWYVCL